MAAGVRAAAEGPTARTEAEGLAARASAEGPGAKAAAEGLAARAATEDPAAKAAVEDPAAREATEAAGIEPSRPGSSGGRDRKILGRAAAGRWSVGVNRRLEIRVALIYVVGVETGWAFHMGFRRPMEFYRPTVGPAKRFVTTHGPTTKVIIYTD